MGLDQNTSIIDVQEKLASSSRKNSMRLHSLTKKRASMKTTTVVREKNVSRICAILELIMTSKATNRLEPATLSLPKWK